MRLINYFKKYRKSTDILLLVLFIGNLVLLGDTVISSFNKDFVVDVVETKPSLANVNGSSFAVDNREISGHLKFSSDKFVDFLLVNKTPHSNLLLFVFTAFVLLQLMRIKTLWYHQYFTKKLYSSIDTLGIISSAMFIFSRIQEIYLVKLVKNMSAGQLSPDIDTHFLTISVVMMLLSAVLKSFAKQGNKLQEEQDLTI